MKLLSITLPVPPRQPEKHDNNEFRDEIKCPSCGKTNWEHTDYPSGLRHDGDEAETECGYCCKPMLVTLCVEYSYATAPVEEKT
jgi:hypothetical protein